MSGGHVLRASARIVAKHGETMTLARAGEATTIALKGKRIPGGIDDVGGSARQQRFRVKIGVAELAASAWSSKVPSAEGDTITIGDIPRAVLDVRPLGDGETVALYELDVVG